MSSKASALSHELADRLRSRSSLTLVESFSGSAPVISIGSGSTTTRSAVITTADADWPEAKDILGLTALKYTPHVVKLITEAAPAGGLTPQDTVNLLGQLADMGAVVEWWQSASGTGPSLAALATPSNLKATFHPDNQYRLISGQ
mgnify:CR=1 FL=1